MNRFTLAAVLLNISCVALAQDKIETDRPDQTETATLVGRRRFQLESGIKREQQEMGSSENSLPELLLKYGVSEHLELRLETDFCFENNRLGTYGLMPVTLGAKIKIASERGYLPQVAVIAQLQFPRLASDGNQADHLAPEIRLAVKKEFSDGRSLGCNIGTAWDGQDTVPEHFYTISPSIELTEKIKVFAETFGYAKPGRHAELWLDGGLSFLISDAVQLDLSAGYEATHAGGFHDFFESLGLSFRI